MQESLCTERISYLSLTMFLRVYCEFHNIRLLSEALHYCDDKTLARQVQEVHQTGPMNLIKQLGPDLDVQIQLKVNLVSLNMETSSEHVKGHQDD